MTETDLERVTEGYGGTLTVDATHMNDGLLRIMAILAQAQSTHSTLLFDEIENGIHPELVERLVDFLIHLDRQVIVTTHSPMVLNYIPDEVAANIVAPVKTAAEPPVIALKEVPLKAVKPSGEDVAITEVVVPPPVQTASLPKTASSLPLLALMGFLCLGVGISLRTLCAR